MRTLEPSGSRVGRIFVSGIASATAAVALAATSLRPNPALLRVVGRPLEKKWRYEAVRALEAERVKVKAVGDTNSIA